MPQPLTTIVAGVSHASPDDPTLLAAAALARASSAVLHLVHAFTSPMMITPSEAAVVPPGWPLEYADEQLAALRAAARASGAENAECWAVASQAAAAILEAEEEAGASLVMVGASRPGRLGAGFLGSTAQRVVRGAAAPVLVVQAPLRPGPRVLLTTDLSRQSEAVHERAMEIVPALLGTPSAVRSLRVLPFDPVRQPGSGAQRAARVEVEAFLAERPSSGMPVEASVREGDAAPEIACEAWEWKADLLVLGTHARGWAGRLVLGSVAEAALRTVSCNVLVVPPRALHP